MNIIIGIMRKTVTKAVFGILLIMFVLSLFFFHAKWEKQIKKIPGYYYVYQGDKFAKKGDYQQAIDYYKKGLYFYPEHAKARCNLGNLYVVYENFYEAAQAYEEALSHNPKDIVCRMDYAVVLAEELGEYDRAVAEYGRVVNTNPFLLHIPFVFNNKKSIKRNKGIAYYNTGVAYGSKSILAGEKTSLSFTYLEKASEAYKEAKKILKKDYDTHYNLALSEQLLGNKKTAGLEYCKAIEIKPFNFEAHYNLGLLLRSMKLYEEAISEFEKAGMSADLSDEPQKNTRLYRLLDEANQRLVNEGKGDLLISRRSESALSDDEISYKNGKVILSDDSEKNLINKMKSCPSKKYFEEL